MKRYKCESRDANSDRQMWEHPRGEWVKFTDAAEALNIVGELADFVYVVDNPGFGLKGLIHRARALREVQGE